MEGVARVLLVLEAEQQQQQPRAAGLRLAVSMSGRTASSGGDLLSVLCV
jgi:hypothetical protein